MSTASSPRFKVGDWARTTTSWVDWAPGAIIGKVVDVRPAHPSGVYSISIEVEGEPGPITVPAEYCEFLGAPVSEGLCFSEFINQGLRDCEVMNVKKTRFRIEFDMPNCVQGGWRHGQRIGDHLFYTFGETRRNRVAPFKDDSDNSKEETGRHHHTKQ